MIIENTKVYRGGEIFMSFNFVSMQQANYIKLNFKPD